MRKYLRNDELYLTLEQIFSRQNPELLEVYKEVILYRTSLDRRPYARTAQMLQRPTQMALAFTNMVITPITCTVFIFSLYAQLPEVFALPAVFGLMCFTVYEAFHFSRLAAQFSACKPYLLVDELFARKILVVQRLSRTKTAKAAK